MTSIKPPAPGSPHTPTESPDLAGTSKSEGADATSFQTALEGAQKAQEAGPTLAASHTGKTGAADPIAALAQDVEAGRITLDQAVDRLVDRTLAKTERHLSADQRSELSGLLRDALMHDPTLSALRGARI
jgi:hypothetical protein